MSMVRHIPVHFENDPWWSRHEWFSRPGYHMYPSSSVMPMSSLPPPTWASPSDPFPLEPRRWQMEESRQSYAMNRELQRMNDEMNKMMSNMQRQAPLGTVDDWRFTENFKMDNPIRSEVDGSRRFHLQFDVRNFKPEEINVKTNGNQLTVHARHEEKDGSKSSFREYMRQYVLPREVNPESLTSKLSADGTLTIEAPLPALQGPREKMIPIEHRK